MNKVPENFKLPQLRNQCKFGTLPPADRLNSTSRSFDQFVSFKIYLNISIFSKKPK